MTLAHPTRRPARTGAVLFVAALLFAPGVTADDEGYAGSEACAICHDEVAAAFDRSPHATAPGWDTERGCESCHGPGEEHVDSGGGTESMASPGDLTPDESADLCLGCHQRQEQHFTSRHAVHRLGDVSCVDCHNPHGERENLLRAESRDLCATCHRAIDAQFDLPRSHPVEDCASCHPPHADRSLRTDTSLFRQVCTDCHFDKQGPYMFDHDVIAIDGCVSCHEVHGSPNRHLLTHEPQVNLCYQCHSASVTPAWHSAPRFLNEKCTACHTAIHGSNTNPLFLEE